MEVLKFGDVEIKANVNLLSLYIHKKEFRSDFFADILRLSKMFSEFDVFNNVEHQSDEKKKWVNSITEEILEKIDTILFCQIFWTMCKTADKETLPFEDFLNVLTEITLIDVIPVVQKLIEKSFKTIKK